jgi:hypothetical protein
MTRLLPYLLSCLLLALLACADDAALSDTAYYEAYTPRLLSRTALEESVQALPPRALHATGKIYLQGHYLFINEPYEGIHVVDNRNPALPRPVSFLRIPGNIDMALKGSLLYADNGPDLVTIDVTNPEAVQVRSRVREAFRELPMPGWGPLAEAGRPENRPANTVVVGWQKIKVAYPAQHYRYEDWYRGNGGNMYTSAAPNSAAPGAGSAGKGGSLARFAVLGESLYTVDDSSLRLFDLSSPATPTAGPKLELQPGIETIYPKDHYLFLGTQRGLYIYDVAQPQSPRQVAFYQHLVSCDPVVVDDRYAYVTLRAGQSCGGGPNQLQVIDLDDLSKPKLARSYPMTGPRGLGVDGQQLFVCDSDGLKVFDTSQAPLLTQTQVFPVQVTDVIPDNGTLLAIGAAGLYQYSYTGTGLLQLSLLPVTPQP